MSSSVLSIELPPDEPGGQDLNLDHSVRSRNEVTATKRTSGKMNEVNPQSSRVVSERYGALPTELQDPKAPGGIEPPTTGLRGEVTETVAPEDFSSRT